MSFFGRIVLDPKDFIRWTSALEGVEAEATRQCRVLPRKCSLEYVGLVRTNLMNQKYAGSYAPYSERYAKWKSLVVGESQGFWKLKLDLLKNITSSLVHSSAATSTWFGGVPSGVMDSGGKSWFGLGDKGKPKPIAMYGRVMEEGGTWPGSGVHPPRPLFGPTRDEYASEKWGKAGEKALNLIARRWK